MSKHTPEVQMDNVETKLRQAYAERLKDVRARAKKERIEAKSVFNLRKAAEALESAGVEYTVYSDWIFVTVNVPVRNKANFSALVKRVATALGEQPDIEVAPKRYVADFKQSKVYFTMWDAEDCQLIETEETVTRKVMRPHPMCLAALKELEDIA
jgi:hypothetical protein